MIGNKNVTSYNANLLDTRPAQVRSWLDGLPLDDVDRAARTILQALVSVKNRRIPVRQRFQLLEAVTSTLTLLLPELAKRTTRTRFEVCFVLRCFQLLALGAWLLSIALSDN